MTCIIMLMQSCINETEPIPANSSVSLPNTTHMVIKYGERLFETDVITGDSVSYLNDEYSIFYNTFIENDDNVAAFLSIEENGNLYVEYFPSEQDLLSKFEFYYLDNMDEEVYDYTYTRSGVIDLWPPNNTGELIGMAELFDDKNFEDTVLVTYATTTWATAVPYLSNLGFNDKTSSIRVHNKMISNKKYTMKGYDENFHLNMGTYYGSQLRPILKCYHNSNYSGSVIYCIAKPTGSSELHLDYNLKNIGWNDRISAISWIVIGDMSYINGSDPAFPAHPEC